MLIKRYLRKTFWSIVSFLERLVLKERSAQKLASSVSVGLFIAFSPYLFMHTVMTFFFAWVFSLNLPAVFAGAFVNNPWTIVPVHSAGYFVGEFFFRSICKIDPMSINPSWMSLVNEPIARLTGLKGVSFWSFMVGGNLLAIAVSVILYPILKRIFARLSIRVYKGAKKSVMDDNESSCTEQEGFSRLRRSGPPRGRDRIDR